MKTLMQLVAGIAFIACCMSAAPAGAQADEELEVTMEVLDDLGDLDEELPEMRGPRRLDDDAGDAGGAGEAAGARPDAPDEAPPGFGDDFEHDDVNDEFDDDLLEEGDFEDGEEVDDDAFDEEQHEDMPDGDA